MESALCLTPCGRSTALLLGALGLGLTLKAADTATKGEEGLFYKYSFRHGIAPCERLEQREKI